MKSIDTDPGSLDSVIGGCEQVVLRRDWAARTARQRRAAAARLKEYRNVLTAGPAEVGGANSGPCRRGRADSAPPFAAFANPAVEFAAGLPGCGLVGHRWPEFAAGQLRRAPTQSEITAARRAAHRLVER